MLGSSTYVEKVEFLIIFEILTRLGIVKRSFTCCHICFKCELRNAVFGLGENKSPHKRAVAFTFISFISFIEWIPCNTIRLLSHNSTTILYEIHTIDALYYTILL